MVLNNVTKFHKILTKSIRLRERTSLGQTYITLNAQAIIMAGAYFNISEADKSQTIKL